MTKIRGASSAIPLRLLEAMQAAAAHLQCACGNLAVAVGLLRAGDGVRDGRSSVVDAYVEAAMDHVGTATRALETGMQDARGGPPSGGSIRPGLVEATEASDRHPPEEQLALFALGWLPQAEMSLVRDVSAHLQGCAVCRACVVQFRERRLH